MTPPTPTPASVEAAHQLGVDACPHQDVAKHLRREQNHCFMCLAHALDAARRAGALEEAARHADCCVDQEERDALRAALECVQRDLGSQHGVCGCIGTAHAKPSQP